jgi:hypothetical protein
VTFKQRVERECARIEPMLPRPIRFVKLSGVRFWQTGGRTGQVTLALPFGDDPKRQAFYHIAVFEEKSFDERDLGKRVKMAIDFLVQFETWEHYKAWDDATKAAREAQVVPPAEGKGETDGGDK